MKTFGRMIAQVRKDHGHTQESLAKALGITKQTICNYEKDKRRPDYEMLEAICDTLNVPMEFFLTKEEQEAELGEIYKNYQAQDAAQVRDTLHISFCSRNKKSDEMRKELHELIDRLSDADLRLLKDLAIRISQGGGRYMD